MTDSIFSRTSSWYNEVKRCIGKTHKQREKASLLFDVVGWQCVTLERMMSLFYSVNYNFKQAACLSQTHLCSSLCLSQIYTHFQSWTRVSYYFLQHAYFMSTQRNSQMQTRRVSLFSFLPKRAGDLLSSLHKKPSLTTSSIFHQINSLSALINDQI